MNALIVSDSGYAKRLTCKCREAANWRVVSSNPFNFRLSFFFSTEEIIDTEEVEDFPDCDGLLGLVSPEGLESLDAAGRANSLDQLYGGQKTRRPAGRYAKWHHDANRSAREGEKMVSPEEEDDGNSYGAYTLPCRRSHCLSEGLTNPRAATCSTMQGRRAQTIQVGCHNVVTLTPCLFFSHRIHTECIS